MKTSLSMPLLLALSACSLTAAPVNYYDGRWNPPSIDDVSDASQGGNVGGQTVTIKGSGFGDDAGKLMVQFGNHNAKIVSASDSELTVVAPAGPVGGGTVPVTVGTYDGYAQAEYTYDTGKGVVEGSGQGTEGEVGYVLVNNYWESCFGGLSSRLEDNYGNGNFTDCQTIAYMGTTGTDGSAEALEFAMDRLHSTSQGWSGGADLADGEWRIERPSEAPFLGGLDDYHIDLGKVSVTNDYWADDDGYCVDFAETATFRYGGGEEGYESPVTVGGGQFPTVSAAAAKQKCDANQVYYPADELQFCAREDADGINGHVYSADWPINENFFQAHDRKDKPADVVLHLPDVGVPDVPMTLPEPLIVYNTEGYEDVFTDQSGAQDVWAAYGTMQHCFDDGNNGERLDDVAFRFEWPVSTAEVPDPEGDVLGVRTYVRVTLTELSVGWFGGLNNPVRATITVPDEYDTHVATNSSNQKETRSQLEIPASVMYQFPTIKFPNPTGLSDVLVPDPAVNYGYMFIEFQRVTEYTVRTDAGPVIFAYVTGDFGFTDWTNPTDDTCHDCLDGDRDGWIDDKDPDCATGTEEVGVGVTACNDGIDNDGDGVKDADDPECANAADKDESNCDDKVDNDGDGFKDALDADCARGDNEGTADACVDGLDNDGDGWADNSDPDCLSGDSEKGLGTGGCNDGVDNDGDGWADVADPDCTEAGASELGYGSDVCNDGVDNDGNGDVDAADPECTSADDADESI